MRIQTNTAQCKRGDGPHTHRRKFRDACDTYSQFRRKVPAHKKAWLQSSCDLDLPDAFKHRIIATYNPHFIRYMSLSRPEAFKVKTGDNLLSETLLGLTVENGHPLSRHLLIFFTCNCVWWLCKTNISTPWICRMCQPFLVHFSALFYLFLRAAPSPTADCILHQKCAQRTEGAFLFFQENKTKHSKRHCFCSPLFLTMKSQVQQKS